MDPLSLRQDRYEIKVYEADALGRANITSLANFLQNSASKHYHAIDRERGPLLTKTQMWLMTRMEIQIERIPKWQEEITVETWSRGLEKATAVREFLLTDRGGQPSVLATTLWVVVDRGTRRIQRLQELATKWPSVPDRTFINKQADKVEPLGQPSHGPVFKATYSDMDVNRHVNNVKYIEWILDSYTQDFLESRKVKKIAVNFLDEAAAGDEVVVSTEKRADTVFLHNVLRCRDNRELCRARIEFT